MSLPIFNNNAGAPIAANGNFCSVTTWSPAVINQSTVGQNSTQMIDLASYYITGGSATGTVTFQELGADGTWRSLALPTALALSANPQNGILNGPFHGIRLAVTALAVSTITYAELKATVRDK